MRARSADTTCGGKLRVRADHSVEAQFRAGAEHVELPGRRPGEAQSWNWSEVVFSRLTPSIRNGGPWRLSMASIARPRAPVCVRREAPRDGLVAVEPGQLFEIRARALGPRRGFCRYVSPAACSCGRSSAAPTPSSVTNAGCGRDTLRAATRRARYSCHSPSLIAYRRSVSFIASAAL